MSPPFDHPDDLALAVRQWLLRQYSDQLTQDELHSLVYTISIYVRRSKLALVEAVPKISAYYMEHGQLVHHLLADPASEIWQDVLTQVITYAIAHPYYPAAEQASAWPDLDAYEDIRRNLPTYNFEGPLDRWINATVVRRLTRFWRDQQALKSGGRGFRSGAVRSQDKGLLPSRVPHISIDAVPDEGSALIQRLGVQEVSVDHQVEMDELESLVSRAVALYAANKFDPQLPELWQALVNQEYKLREVADKFGMTIGQVYHRYIQLREHLRADPQIASWFDASK